MKRIPLFVPVQLLEQIEDAVARGVADDRSDFIRDAVREKLARSTGRRKHVKRRHVSRDAATG